MKLIEQDGWFLVRTRGSHRHFKHPAKQGLVTIAGHPSVDVPAATFNSILEQAGLRPRPMRDTIVIEEGPASFGACVPDLPGCVAAAETRDEVLRLIREAIEFHIEALRQDGQPVPEPHSVTESIEVAA